MVLESTYVFWNKSCSACLEWVNERVRECESVFQVFHNIPGSQLFVWRSEFFYTQSILFTRPTNDHGGTLCWWYMICVSRPCQSMPQGKKALSCEKLIEIWKYKCTWLVRTIFQVKGHYNTVSALGIETFNDIIIQPNLSRSSSLDRLIVYTSPRTKLSREQFPQVQHQSGVTVPP